jgi:hypothetical protein
MIWPVIETIAILNTRRSFGYAPGDRVRLLKDIWEDEVDGLIPPGYLARKGEILIVKKVIEGSNISFGIAHEYRTDDAYFWVAANEIERA